MKAPSEKHLQDYIWNKRNQEYDPNTWEFPWFHLVGREIKLPSGYADFIALYCPLIHGLPINTIVVVEIKKDAVNHHTLTQTLRYIRDVHKIWKYAIAGMVDLTCYGDYQADSPAVSGVMIGSSASDEIMIAAEAAHIEVMTYDFDGVGYTFDYPQSPQLADTEYMSFHDSDIADMIRRVYQEEIETANRRWPERRYINEPTIGEYWEWYERRVNRKAVDHDAE